MKTDYTPIDPDYFEIVENEIMKNKVSKIFFFKEQNELGEEKGEIDRILTVGDFEKFLLLANGTRIRMDRIVTINGIPGPAYDEYDRYALACLECNLDAGNVAKTSKMK
jgi:hypothetical protein